MCVHGAQPTAELPPDPAGAVECEVLKESLCDASQLNIDMVGLEFSADCASVWGGLVV